MSTYLERAWPIEATSTVRMSGKAVFNLRRWRRPGIVTQVIIFPADAQTFREEVEKYGQAMKEEERARIMARREAAIRALAVELEYVDDPTGALDFGAAVDAVLAAQGLY